MRPPVEGAPLLSRSVRCWPSIQPCHLFPFPESLLLITGSLWQSYNSVRRS